MTSILKVEQKQLRADINKGKGAIWLLIAISGIIAAGLSYFKN